MPLRGKLGLLLALCVSVLVRFDLYAQSQTLGRLAGTVQDPRGQIIPRAKVLCSSSATGESKNIETNDSGDFLLIALSPGTYDIRVTAPGFAPRVFHSVAIAPGESVSLLVVLQLAQNTTEIVVHEEPSRIESASSELGAELDSASVGSLPLSSRNSLQLLSVTPGASTPLTNNSVLGRNSPEVSINGARVTQNHYQINGVDADNPSMHDLGDVAVPAPDSIGEIKVKSSLYDASVSGAGGSSIELTTKSGSNTVHGSAYGYFRNEALNANDPNLKSVGLSRPVDRQSVYGGTLGGPIRKDKVFYFASYQGMLATNGATGRF